ncbi:hypothetical protein F5050DRAFT_1805735 [Lentinula boryana]|uniref:DUF6534 domain-containing protein n=1 Tax=Lentinula boryana TaxID=40481 RepID=A0ABQ8QJX2_9AGAR|nr:hypothetical protein F5050DRAFT_1805735 [Lentinula boryana]
MATILKVSGNAPLVASPSFLLTGAWINLLFYSIEFLVGSYYFFKVPQRKIKALVAVALLVDTVGTISTCQYTWVALITLSEKTLLIPANKPVEAVAEPFLLASIMSSLSAFIEQSYFAHRVWTITQSRLILSILCALIVIPMACILASIALALKLDPAVDQSELAILNIIATFLGVITDIVIAVYLVYKLRSINLLQFSYSTKCLIRKITAYTVACGCITACFTMVTTTLTFVSVGPFLLFFACNGRVYTLTILANFLLFHEWRRDYDEKRRSSHNHNDNQNTYFRWKGSTWSRRFTNSLNDTSTSSPRYPPSALRHSRTSVSVVRMEIHGAVHGAVHETFQKPVPGPPFSIESIFSKSDEDLTES